MKKRVLFQILYAISAMIFLFGAMVPIFADDKKLVGTVSSQLENVDLAASNSPRKSLMNSTFVLETDQESAAESLERVSGDIDLGFSAPENTYKTEERPGAGPFAKEKAELKKQGTAAH